MEYEAGVHTLSSAHINPCEVRLSLDSLVITHFAANLRERLTTLVYDCKLTSVYDRKPTEE